ncbi:PhzF family phenazine biosynthesis protein [Vagococcus vulneris]|uniref:Phenazine biosynthesis protein PhzF n=1 Tax=Vagococcus vulneris TaxID=1977869 RepID=A0A429ZYC0_9ENTE|nr:PhzF family phenazine biosynthesis protein [Vagococcus vulneris]RST98941.1 phenazine biosynthesis protein PhzF [Vagococcus vulneris]
MIVQAHIVNAFSKNKAGGNKAGVVFDNGNIFNHQKCLIAKKLGYSETVFISKSEVADYKLEFFTPKEEVDLCGHATIGAFCVLMYLKKLDKKHYTIETKKAVLRIVIKDDLVYMEQNKPSFYEIINQKELTCFSEHYINKKYPVQVVSTGLRDIIVPIKNSEILLKMRPDFRSISNLSKKFNTIGMHLFTFDDDKIICRNFAPLYDIDEESATGTSNCALACYLYHHNIMKKKTYVFEQGHLLNSTSEIIVNLSTDEKDTISNVLVGGRGYYDNHIEVVLD